MTTILCIDDDAKALSCRKEMLETNGYRVLVASDGPSGIELARKHSIDVVVLDYSMGGMMGDATAEVLKHEHAILPIILLTAFGWEHLPEALFHSVDGFVQKGEPAAVLLGAIEHALKFQRRKPIKGMPPKEEREAG